MKKIIFLMMILEMAPAKEKILSKLALLNVLKKSPPNVRCQLINFLNSQGIQVLSESIFNVLFNEAPLTKNQKRKIRKQCSNDKNLLKQISKKRGSFKKKRKLLKQTGNGLATLLGEKYIKTAYK